MNSFQSFLAEEPFRRRLAHTNRAHDPFQTDEMGRPDPNPQVQREAVDYCFNYNLPRPNHSVYVGVDQLRGGRIADAYDALPLDDSNNPAVVASYEALAREVEQQWQWAVARGMVFEPWTGSGEAYGSDSDVFKPDADMFHRHLYFFTGGEPNRFMARVSKLTGLPINDMFRAIHDYYGHACIGSDFGPVGEENAWVSHMQMFSPEAQAALTTETRGQNNWVNFGRQNYDERGEYLYKDPIQRPFAVQKTAIFEDEDAWILRLPMGVTVRALQHFESYITEVTDMPTRPAMCEWGSCTEPAVAFVRFRNAIGQPTNEGYWYCGHHADNTVTDCPRGDFIEWDARWIKEDVQMAVASANLRSFRYDETTNTLTVRFRSGGVYVYENVPPDVVDEMRWAESRGRYFWRFIRTSYSYTMLTAPDPGFSHAYNTAKSSTHLRRTLKVPRQVHKLPRLT